MPITKTFQIEFTQYLDEHANTVNPLPSVANELEQLVSLYQKMLRLRIFDNKAVALQRTGKMGTYASCLGQEAITVAIGATMMKNDVLVPAYREYGAQFQRGVIMQDIFAYWGGDERGNAFQNPEDLPMAVPIASQCLHAAGVGKAIQLRKQSRAVVCVCGDGATSEGDFYEAINVAGAWKLPVVFVVCNNQWAISVPRQIQSGAETLAQKAIAAGIPSEQVDGNDLIALYTHLERALEAARKNNQPCLIEAITYRLSDHTTADDATRYRDDAELKAAWQREPLVRLKKYLIQHGAWSEEKEQQFSETCKQEVDQAVKAYVEREPQPPQAMFDYLYETLPDAYLDQYEIILTQKRSAH